MSRIEKEIRRLDQREAEFRERLVEALRSTASGNNSLLFLASELRPDHWPQFLTSPITDDLLAEADQLIELRAGLGLAEERCLARRFREACSESCNIDDHHRFGSQRLAEQLLSEILDA